MTHVELFPTYATQVMSAAASTCYYGRTTYVGAQSGAREAFLQFASPWPSGTTQNVPAATLTLHTAAAVSGSTSITVALLAAPVTLGKATWNNTRKVTTTGTPVTVTKSGTQPAGTAWVFNVAPLLQLVASGSAKFYGFKITSATSDHPTAFRVGYSPALNPVLSVDYGQQPLPPAGMNPSGGAVVSAAQPTLAFAFVDHGGDTTMQSVRVQMSTSSTMNPLLWSGQVDTGTPEVDLSGVSGAPTLTAGTTYWWNARVEDGDGLWSNWSTPTSFTYQPLPTVTLNNPDPKTPVVYDPTPPIDWTFNSAAGAKQAQWAVQLWKYQKNGSLKLVSASGYQRTTETRWTPAGALPGTGDYLARVVVWDDVTGRQATPGAGVYVAAEQTFTYEPTSDMPAPTRLSVAKVVPAMPGATLTWSATSQPDEWIIYRDGKPMGRYGGADLLTQPNTYRWTDALAPAGEHTWEVQPVINSHSGPAAWVTWVNRFAGTWLCRPAGDARRAGDMVRVLNDTDHSMQLPETSAQLDVLGAAKPVTVVSGMAGGYTGKVDGGVLIDSPGLPDGQTARVWRENLLDFKTDTGAEFLLLGVGDLALPVQLHNVTVAPMAHLSDKQMWSCGFEYVQCDDYIIDFEG